MSAELYVLAKRSQLPSLPEWQGALDQSAFSIKLDPSVNLLDHSGFLPCTYKGAPTGFELSIGSGSGLMESYPELQSRTEHLDAVATFSWGGDINQCVSAVCSAAVLTQLSHGLMYDPQEGQSFDGSQAILQARQVVESL
jgi:hypothetical protein